MHMSGIYLYINIWHLPSQVYSYTMSLRQNKVLIFNKGRTKTEQEVRAKYTSCMAQEIADCLQAVALMNVQMNNRSIDICMFTSLLHFYILINARCFLFDRASAVGRIYLHIYHRFCQQSQRDMGKETDVAWSGGGYSHT